MHQRHDVTIGNAIGKLDGRRRSFGLRELDRFRHVHIVGKTGMGKSTLLRNLIAQDMASGAGVGLIDPHGDLAEAVLRDVPKRRSGDFLYFNPADPDFAVGFNPLHNVPASNRSVVAGALVDSFHHIWEDSWGPRLEYILRICILTLLDAGNETLVGVLRMLVEEDYRKRVSQRAKNPTVRLFWAQMWPSWSERYRAEAIGPVVNKIDRMLGADSIRAVLGQVAPKMDLGVMLNSRRILVANLSKGALSEGDSSLLGVLLVSMLSTEAMRRVRIRESERAPFFLYLDEFQNFASPAFSAILSEARKYKLGLTLAHQYLDQLPEELQSAIFGNCGSSVCFRLGIEDTQPMARQIDGHFVAEDLTDLDPYEVAARLADGQRDIVPYSAMTLAPLEVRSPASPEKLLRHSRERFSEPRSEVEEKIKRWLQKIAHERRAA